MSSTNQDTDKRPFDVREEHVARAYAKAFLGVAQGPGDATALVEELDSLRKDIWDRFPRFAKVLESRSVSHDDRCNLIDNVLRGRASQTVVDFLKVLSANDRINLLRTISRLVHKMHGEAQGRRQVRVLSAQPLSGDLERELQAALRAKLKVDPEITVEVEPDLIAGLVIQIGDTVYDGSVRTSLEKTRHAMIERSIDAITNHPNDFHDEFQSQS